MDCNNLPLISVVVPVYNVEPYLDRCVKSIVSQTYKNLQIILVDDGSTDKSGEMCDEYSKKDTRIIVIHKKNGGLSDARNVGIEIANGQYITFIDSDDSVENDMIEYLYYLVKNYNCRMSLCTHAIVFNDGDKIKRIGNGIEEKLTDKECIERMCYHKFIDTSAWAKLYETSIFKTIKYPKGKLFEDIGTTYKTFMECKSIACGYKPKYYYYVRSNSIVTSSFSVRKLDLIEMTDKMATDVLSVYPELVKPVLCRKVYSRFSTLNQMLNTGECGDVKESLVNYIRNNTVNVLLDIKIPLKNKVASVLLCVSLDLYKSIWQNFKRYI